MADDTTPDATGVTASGLEQVDALIAEAEKKGDTVTVRDQTFSIAGEIPAIVMLRLTAAGDSKTPAAKQMGAIVQFLHHAIDAGDREAFEALLEDADPVIGFDELNTVLEKVTAAIAARPTVQP